MKRAPLKAQIVRSEPHEIMLNPVQLVSREEAREGRLAAIFAMAGSGQPSGLRHAGTTNNVTIRDAVRQSGRERYDGSSQSVCMLLEYKQMSACVARVKPGTESGMRRATYRAVPRQGYGRN
jgi:lysyl-tRNA synthetase class I